MNLCHGAIRLTPSQMEDILNAPPKGVEMILYPESPVLDLWRLFYLARFLVETEDELDYEMACAYAKQVLPDDIDFCGPMEYGWNLERCEEARRRFEEFATVPGAVRIGECNG